MRQQLNGKVASCRALLKRAEETISSGLADENMEQVQSEQQMLTEANISLSAALSQLEELNSIYKKRRMNENN